MPEGLHNAPIVLDNGSGTIRAGFAGDDLPKCYFPSVVGRPKHPRVLAGGLEGDTFIGARAQDLRGLLKLRYPLEQGVVTDWEDMERIWTWVYVEELRVLSEEVRLAHRNTSTVHCSASCKRRRALTRRAAPYSPHRTSPQSPSKPHDSRPDPL